MAEKTYGTFTSKDGKHTRTAYTAEQAVRFRYRGWTEDPAALPVPPRGGAGSGREPWAAYAADNGVEVADDMQRDDIIAALDAASIATTPTEGESHDGGNGGE